MLIWAAETYNGPVAVRYPRGTEGCFHGSGWTDLPEHVENTGLMMAHKEGGDVLLITYGSMLDNVLEAADLLESQGIHPAVVRLLTLSALPCREIIKYLPASGKAVVVEETAHGSGVCQRLAAELRQLKPACEVMGMDLGPDYVPHGQIKKLYEYCGVDPESIAAKTKELLES